MRLRFKPIPLNSSASLPRGESGARRELWVESAEPCRKIMMTSTSLRQIARRTNARLLIAALLTLVFAGREVGRRPVQAVSNPIVVENSQTGTLDNWDISGSGDPSIQGFATDISVN